jgi:hypothetical protein
MDSASCWLIASLVLMSCWMDAGMHAHHRYYWGGPVEPCKSTGDFP